MNILICYEAVTDISRPDQNKSDGNRNVEDS